MTATTLVGPSPDDRPFKTLSDKIVWWNINYPTPFGYTPATDYEVEQCLMGKMGQSPKTLGDLLKSSTPPNATKYPHYFKDVRHLNEVDVYRVLELFNVTDQAIGHAIKKLLVAGGRGVKDRKKDVREAVDTLNRRIAMWGEDKND